MAIIVEQKTPPVLNSRALKVTLLLSPAEVLTYPVPEQQARVKLRIKVPPRPVTADITPSMARHVDATDRARYITLALCNIGTHSLKRGVRSHGPLSAH